jgi:hypothetical protein
MVTRESAVNWEVYDLVRHFWGALPTLPVLKTFYLPDKALKFVILTNKPIFYWHTKFHIYPLIAINSNWRGHSVTEVPSTPVKVDFHTFQNNALLGPVSVSTEYRKQVRNIAARPWFHLKSNIMEILRSVMSCIWSMAVVTIFAIWILLFEKANIQELKYSNLCGGH